MKKKLIIYALTLFMLTSCNNIEDSNEFSVSPLATSEQDHAISEFINSVDSLNSAFFKYDIRKNANNNNNNNKNGNNKGKQDKHYNSLNASAVIGMDAMGLVTGGVGGSLFSPLGTLIGGIAGAIGSSYTANEALKEKKPEQGKKPKEKVAKSSTLVPPPTTSLFLSSDTEVEKSLGYLHNNIISELYEMEDSFLSEDGGIVLDKLLYCCISLLEKYGIDCEDLKNNESFIKNISDLITCSLPSYEDYANGEIDLDDCLNQVETNIINKYGQNNVALIEFKDLQTRILPVLSESDSTQITNYGQALKNVIDKSNLSVQNKKEINKICDITFNSALLWESKREIK